MGRRKMDKIQRISEVLHYIEDHLDEIADYEQVAIHLVFHHTISTGCSLPLSENPLAHTFVNAGWQASLLLTDLTKPSHPYVLMRI